MDGTPASFRHVRAPLLDVDGLVQFRAVRVSECRWWWHRARFLRWCKRRACRRWFQSWAHWCGSSAPGTDIVGTAITCHAHFDAADTIAQSLRPPPPPSPLTLASVTHATNLQPRIRPFAVLGSRGGNHAMRRYHGR